ncbi:double-strand break repair helicase AddA [Alteriqipengyuania sp. WL0013]|uniref:double-strand break repair helicase AddA n=1 Tax=Alteriqipengyuania sp. WL0013 TaxID=3110773 RepID=UPI002CFE0EC1|nr:double-strand break repair helicase AddA [Alteriqipengyuania sp. WL0013]MEB3415205.1 double-strand break repair helicase AddA [Alteriqipengyuania sp. WL0013]
MSAVYPLHGAQQLAVLPEETVWLSASAGTGKTQVLSARVLRLLLRDRVEPSQILCLTFTKAGAAEMATRVNEVLARWVRLPDDKLAAELSHIGAPVDPDTRERARTLFASVRDTPGGGLRIDTIHAFAQWLLAAFPEEAGLLVGSKAMEDRDRELLARDVLSELADSGDAEALATLEALSLRMGPDGVRSWMQRCVDHRAAWEAPQWAEPQPLRGPVLGLLGLPADATAADLEALCRAPEFDEDALQACAAANASWGTKTGFASADAIAAFLATDKRVEALEDLTKALFTQAGDPRSLKSLEKHELAYAEHAERLLASIERIADRRRALGLAEWLAPALELGRRYSALWEEAKSREGFVDFDDQIRLAARLLARSDVSAWIRYKLDRQFDHILVDEAQDTNAAQWTIIDALTEEFFAGEGQHADKVRTLFVVGDYKQAIFGFQGTSPENFRTARERVAARMARVAENRATLRERGQARELQELGLDRSFRTAQPVLDFVDSAIAAIGPEEFGLPGGRIRHDGQDRPGIVALWPPTGLPDGEEDEGEGDEDAWLSRPDRDLADRIARQVRAWMDEGFPLVKGTARRAGPGDVMVLVRKRKELASLIVARLYAAGVPVAGVDRLRLGAPLAVQDLMAAIRFAVQPGDDLSLANLLVSPLVGWTQEELLEHAYRPAKTGLWSHLRDSDAPLVQRTALQLGRLLERADYEPPETLLHWMLSGPWQGRRKLVARLGREANDPIDELVNAAYAYSASHVVSLQGFVRWFDAGDGEIKREQGESSGEVRVMTVHGSKGLQAPIVILADAADNPRNSRSGAIALQAGLPDGVADDVLHRPEIPVPSVRSDERPTALATALERQQAADMQEHWRLLYVAMTRAEEALFIAGSLGAREDEPAADSWYARLEPLFPSEAQASAIWGDVRQVGELGALPPAAGGATLSGRPALPSWATTPIGPEPRPPRPLAPSNAGVDEAPDPPLPPDALRDAARRGVLIHRLLERLPDVALENRREAGAAWLTRQAVALDEPTRAEMLDQALAVLDSPDFAALFSPRALAEIPLTAVVDGQVIAGTADRLLVTADTVTVVDYKTTRRPPAVIGGVPAATIRQMGAYAAALGAIYPGRRIEAAVLYTHAPRLITIPEAMLAAAKPALPVDEESFRG